MADAPRRATSFSLKEYFGELVKGQGMTSQHFAQLLRIVEREAGVADKTTFGEWLQPPSSSFN